MSLKTFEGKLDAKGLRFAIVVSRFNSFITERLISGALDALHRSGASDDNVEVVRVPGLLGDAGRRLGSRCSRNGMTPSSASAR